MISHTCSLSYLCSSWKAISSSDKTSVEEERIFQRDFICFSIPPWHPIGTAAPASGDEARPCLFGAKRGYLRFLEVLSRDLSLCRRMGRNTGRVYEWEEEEAASDGANKEQRRWWKRQEAAEEEEGEGRTGMRRWRFIQHFQLGWISQDDISHHITLFPWHIATIMMIFMNAKFFLYISDATGADLLQ